MSLFAELLSCSALIAIFLGVVVWKELRRPLTPDEKRHDEEYSVEREDCWDGFEDALARWEMRQRMEQEFWEKRWSEPKVEQHKNEVSITWRRAA